MVTSATTTIGFLTRDPIKYRGSKWNLYELFDGRALNGRDPSGLKTVKCVHIPPATRVGESVKEAVGMAWDSDMNDPGTNPLPVELTIMYWVACTQKTTYSYTYTCACPCKPPSNIPIFSTVTAEKTLEQSASAKIHVPGGIAVLKLEVETKWGVLTAGIWTIHPGDVDRANGACQQALFAAPKPPTPDAVTKDCP